MGAPEQRSASTRVQVAGHGSPALESLAAAARAIAGATTVDDLLDVITDAAQALIGTRLATTTRVSDGDQHDPQTPSENQLAAPLISRHGKSIGLIELSDKVDGSGFTLDDEALLVQLALMASAALEHLEVSARLERTIAHLGLALDASKTGIWEWDVATNRVTWSTTLERMYGFEPGTFPGTFEAYQSVLHPDDRETALERVSKARENHEQFSYAHRIVCPDGSVRWVEGVGLPLFGPDGALQAMTGASIDVTERRWAELRVHRQHELIRRLHDVARTITSQLDLDQIVQDVTDAATELSGAAFGAFFYNVVDLAGESYQLYTISGVPREEFSRFPMPRNTGVFAPTFAGEDVVRLQDVTADPRYGNNPPHCGMPEGHLPVRSYLAAPVVLRDGEVAGGLFFGHPDVGVFDEDAEGVVVGIAAYAAVAIENARLYETVRWESETRRRVAEALQRPLQAPELPRLAGIELAAAYYPFGGELDIGGDFYDVIPLDDGRCVVVLGDVCGKGPDAAAVSGLARHTLRASLRHSSDLQEVLGVLNRTLLDHGEDRFVTAVIATLAPGPDGSIGVEVASAGHPDPLLVTESGPARAHSRGTLLGVFEKIETECTPLTLEPGETLVLFTDGLLERAGGRTINDIELHSLAGSVVGSANDLLELLVAGSDALAPPRDDVAMLAVRAPSR